MLFFDLSVPFHVFSCLCFQHSYLFLIVILFLSLVLFLQMYFMLLMLFLCSLCNIFCIDSILFCLFAIVYFDFGCIFYYFNLPFILVVSKFLFNVFQHSCVQNIVHLVRFIGVVKLHLCLIVVFIFSSFYLSFVLYSSLLFCFNL